MAFAETAPEHHAHPTSRGFFIRALADQVADNNTGVACGAMLMIDVGRRFDEGEVNDVVDAMCACLAQGNLLTCTARGEFAVLLPDAGRHETLAIADALLGAIHRHEGSKTGGWRSSASIGVALESDVAPLNAVTLRTAADRALYDAQSSGKDRLAIYDSRRHDDCA